MFQQDEKLQKFLTNRITHDHHNAAYNKLVHEAANAPKGSLIYVIGPTGVGKTTLLEHFEKSLTEEVVKMSSHSPSDMPVVKVEARAPDSKAFSWNGFYRAALEAMMEPVPDKKRDREYRTHHVSKQSRVITHELRSSFEATLKKRKVIVFIIDEAQHIAIGAGPKEIIKHLEVVKSLANLGGTVFVLSGVYDLVDFRNLSGQVGRRTIDVHFSRYRLDKTADATSFASIVATFQSRLPFPSSPPLRSIINDLYAGSLGCIGILKEWLDRSVKDAARENSSVLTMEHLNRNVLQFDQLKTIYEELLHGEPKMNTTPDTLVKMKDILRVKPSSKETTAAEKPEVPETKKSIQKKRKPGELKPQRFPTGNLASHQDSVPDRTR